MPSPDRDRPGRFASLAGGCLVAAPQLRDTNFSRTVILLLQHDPDGALGLVMNRSTPVEVSDAVEDAPSGTSMAQTHALWGGPVDRGIGFVVYRGRAPEGWNVGRDLAASGSRDRLAALLAEDTQFHLCLGYAGWGPGQLEREFAEGSWVHVDAEPTLLLDTPVEDRYERALASLGVAPELLWMTSIDA